MDDVCIKKGFIRDHYNHWYNLKDIKEVYVKCFFEGEGNYEYIICARLYGDEEDELHLSNIFECPQEADRHIDNIFLKD